ncbi:MAG: hypothetical protein JWQ09_4920 [Segetibacter sp.]|nr:hypothetical protein [Segetibacter sp.]
MINITSQIVDRGEFLEKIKELIANRYTVTNDVLDSSIKNIENYMKGFIDDLWFVIEHPYVDKLYRDTFYHYFSSKLGNYSRDSIKISIFNAEINDEEFRNLEYKDKLKASYLGFFTIRPTFPAVIGRSVLSPATFLVNDFVCCQTSFDVTANSVKFPITGFPHCSQDAETISCAETTIWSIIEYFSHKYPEYKPALPSHITKIINKFSVERLIPSKGLTAALISYALKELGFGVKIYARKSYGANFDSLLKTYIESGIPVVGAMSNNQGIGHAFNIIGREIPDAADFDNIQVTEHLEDGSLAISDYYTMPLKYVFVDDNFPPYQLTTIDVPSAYYSSPRWKDCEISMFIAPLYPKIYLEADTARKLANSYVKQFKTLKLISRGDVVLKTFLTSSRSYKEYLALGSGLDSVAKELLLATSMPKFIWVTEMSEIALLKQQQCFGVILIDATEPKKEGVVAALFENKYLSYDFSKFNIFDIPLQPFNVYLNNLK